MDFYASINYFKMSEMYIYVYFKMSEMYIYVPKLPLFTFYCNARGFVLINKLFIYYLFSNFCHNKTNILYYIISYYMLHPIIYNTCFLSYILKYSMFTFHFPPFSPFVCQTRCDMETTKIP